MAEGYRRIAVFVSCLIAPATVGAMSAGWPDWVPGTGRLAELVRYVAPFAVGELGLIPPNLPRADQGGEYSDVARQRLETLYEWLQSKEIACHEPPWSREAASAGVVLRTQRVKPPAEAVRGPATHLDIALVFMAMLLSADVRAFLLVSEDGLLQPLVCADLREPLAEGSGQGPRGFTEQASAPGVFVTGTGPDEAVRAIRRLTPDRGWMVLDPSRAMLGPAGPVPFDRASGRRLLTALPRTAGPESSRWYLVDVGRLREVAPPHDPPHGLAVPAVFSQLPSALPFVEYSSRRELVRNLRITVRSGGPPTVLVLCGPPGIGKSRLALLLATAADYGNGWMLNAANAGTLRASLARAQAGERAYADEVLDPESMRALAAEALHQLNASEAPWVLILDNCDSPPGAPGLRPLIPRPHARGQLLILTTSSEGWLSHASGAGWEAAIIPPLSDEDLSGLHIPRRFHTAVDGRPLIAQIVKAIGGADRPADDLDLSAANGPRLAWELFLRSAPDGGVIRLARTMAWCPADPVRLSSVLATSYPRAGRSAADDLARSQIVSFTELTDAPAIVMHPLIAHAIREQTWRDDPAVAAEIGQSLVRSDACRALFVEAADGTALATLASDAQTALKLLPGADHWLLWHGLGVIRERRGPIRESGQFFDNAVRLLDRAMWPYETAESLIGRVRVVFQTAASTAEELRASQADLTVAAGLLAPLTDVTARQLRERGNALALLIERKLAKGISDARERRAKLHGLIDMMWQSYEQRVRISAGLPDGEPVGRRAPELAWGLDPDRAYFNLAGFYVDLAKSAGRDVAEVREHLELAGSIYNNCRRLRERRYAGRNHPQLAACIHGEGIVAYFLATLAGERYRLVDAAERVSAALTMRSNVASAFAAADPGESLEDGDVQKSANLLAKIAVATVLFRGRDQRDRRARANDVVDEVLRETASPTSDS